MNVLSLFSGIGLHDLGLERAGMTIIAQAESDPWCNAVLERHWPHVQRFGDVRDVSALAVRSAVDLVTGGFPCQPHSLAGKRKGTDDERWLWPEYLRIVRELRPRWVLAENVPGIRTTAADLVLADLEAEGYSVWPLVVGADDVGAPHRRKRVWFVAHLARDSERGELEKAGSDRMRARACRDAPLADRESERWSIGRKSSPDMERDGQELAFCSSAARFIPDLHRRGERAVGDADIVGGREEEQERRQEGRAFAGRPSGDRWPSRPGESQHPWEAPRLTQPGLGGATDGCARRMDGFARRNRLKALGNGNPPQVAEVIGRAILREEERA